MNKTCVIYGRFSSDRQEQGDSKRRQIQSAQKWAEKNGYSVRSIFFDEGVSAKIGKNLDKEFSNLLNNLKPNESILVEDLDRISRMHPWLAKAKIYEILTDGHNIVTWRDNKVYDSNSLDDLSVTLVADVNSALAHQENVKKSFRQTERWKGWLQEIEKGKQVCCSKPPGWLKFENGKYEIKNGCKQVIERIFDMTNNGIGSIVISKTLIKENIPSFGKVWNDSYVRNLLKSKSVIGVFEVKGKEFPNFFPRIIPDNLFFTVQNRLRKCPHLGGRPNKDSINLFTHLLKCKCGGSFVTVGGSHDSTIQSRNIVCNNARLGLGCKFSVLRYNWLEESFLTFFDNEDFALMFSNKTKQDQKTEESLNGQISDIDKQITKLMSLIENDDNPSKTLVNKLKSLEHEKEKVKLELDQLRIDTKSDNVNIDEMERIQNEVVKNYNDPQYRIKLRAFFRQIVEKIVIESTKKEKIYTVHFRNSDKTKTVTLLNRDEMIMDGKKWIYGFGD